MGDEPDRNLIQQTLGGQRDAFDVLVRRHRPSADRMARRYLRENVDDVLQDAFTEAYVKLATLQDRDRFARWLLAIVRNRCLSDLRRPVHLSYDDAVLVEDLRVDETLSGPEDRFIQQERETAVRSALRKLTPSAQRSPTSTTCRGSPTARSPVNSTCPSPPLKDVFTVPGSR